MRIAREGLPFVLGFMALDDLEVLCLRFAVEIQGDVGVSVSGVAVVVDLAVKNHACSGIKRKAVTALF